MSIVYLNGRFLPEARARVSALDRGLLFGDGLFETMRSYRGRPFALAAHLDRLRRAALHIHLSVRGNDAWWESRMVGLLRRNRLDDAAVRLTITRGDAGDGLLPPRRAKPTVLMTTRRLDPRIPALQRRGVRVVVLPFHPGLGGFLAGRKTIDYLTALVGKTIARRRGAFEGIYSTPEGELLEGTTSNLFLVKGRRLVTPPLRRGVLPGITRGIVLRLARRAGLETAERPVTRRDLGSADEAFLTATTIEILPIQAVDQRRIGVADRPVTRRLQELFGDLHV